MTPPETFKRHDPRLGEFRMRLVNPPGDAELIHAWVTHPKCGYWMMGDAGLADVWAEHESISANPHHHAYIGAHQWKACFLAEVYDPAHTELAGVYDVKDGDVGMHLLAAPTDRPVSGFTRAVMRIVMELVFDGFGALRVVVEPDSSNTAIHRLNAWAGFTAERTVRLPDKKALLSFCTRDAFDRALTKGNRT